MSFRLLDTTRIPRTLWEADEAILVLPPALASAYCETIDRLGLRGLAAKRNRDKPPVGGLTRELADEHFAQAFDGSVARTQLAVLDPLNHVAHVSNAFVEALAGNCVCITDAPCGAGAAAFALLTTIAELRSQNVLPRQPLDVCLIGAELSVHSRGRAHDLFESIRHALEREAIFITHSLLHWDVTDALSNTDLIKTMIRSSTDGTKKLLIVANFNGLLERDGKRKDAAPQIAELFRFSSGAESTAIWIEPQMNEAVGSGGTFSWLISTTQNLWRRFVSGFGMSGIVGSAPMSSARFREPLDTTSTPWVRLAVMRLDLERTA